MSTHSIPQLRAALGEEREFIADDRKLLKLPLGASYQGVTVTAEHRRLWSKALDRHKQRAADLQAQIRRMERS